MIQGLNSNARRKRVVETTQLPFASQMNFLDPQKMKNDQGEEIPYGPARYKELVKERWYISKNTYVSYEDTGKMTPTEKNYFIEFINEEYEKTHAAMEKAKQEAEAKSKRHK